MKAKKERNKESRKPFNVMSVMNKLFCVIDFPFVWARKLTIPPCEEEEYDNWLVVVWPFLGIPVAGMIILK